MSGPLLWVVSVVENIGPIGIPRVSLEYRDHVIMLHLFIILDKTY